MIEFPNKPAIALAPMAGITDKPMRQIARHFGADWTVSEMLTSDPGLQHTRKTVQRRDHSGETGPIVVQVAGSDPEQLAAAARFNVEQGAQIIDINMGCPAKKVCNVLAGSALLQNEPLVEQILQTVVRAVNVPVTLKTRLGWDDAHQNLPTIAKMAEQAGISALAVHGRTRTQMYNGQARYELIAQVKQSIGIPVWVNGDIVSPQTAVAALSQTGADGVMIGRAAQGQPWLLADIRHHLDHGSTPPPMAFQAAADAALAHIAAIHTFYGNHGTRIARKHIGWYLSRLPDAEPVRKAANTCEQPEQQYQLLESYFKQLAQRLSQWPRDY